MRTATVETISNTSGSLTVPTKELTSRIIQQYNADYTAGEWNPNNTYTWAPGGYVDFTPRLADSRISYIWRVPHACYRGQTHAISHWKFFVNGVVYFWHSVSGRHIEDGNVLKWDVPSWGTTQGRIGYQIRSYSNDNHEVRLYRTDYWNGTSSAQTANGQLIVEEYAGVSNAVSASQYSFRAG